MTHFALTPSEAKDEMHKIAKRGDREAGIQLLCRLVRATGYYRAAELFEEIKTGAVPD